MSQRGFTLLEAMVVVVIMGILAAVAAPHLGTWMDNVRIRNTAESLQQGLQTARAEAIKRNQDITFWLVTHNLLNTIDNSCELTSTSGSWVVSVNDPNKHCADTPSTDIAPRIVRIRSIGDAGGNVSVSAFAADGTTPAESVTFNGFGRATKSDGIARINITGPDANGTYKDLQVRISPTGQIRSCDPAITTAGDPRKC